MCLKEVAPSGLWPFQGFHGLSWWQLLVTFKPVCDIARYSFCKMRPWQLQACKLQRGDRPVAKNSLATAVRQTNTVSMYLWMNASCHTTHLAQTSGGKAKDTTPHTPQCSPVL